MTRDQILANLNDINAQISTEINHIIIGLVEEKLVKLSSLMGTSAECLRYAKLAVGKRQQVLMNTEKAAGMQPSVLKMWIEGEMAEEIAIYTFADRVNAAIVHCSDSLRTVISKYKEELRIGSQNQV